MRTLMPSATSLLTVDLVAEGLEMPEKKPSGIYKIQENASHPGFYPGPAVGKLKALPI